MNRDNDTLIDITNAARLILDFMQNITEAQFQTDIEKQSAVLYQLSIIGEAVKRLSAGFRNQNPAIPWRQIAGMRDHLFTHMIQ